MKTLWANGRVSANAAVFYIDWDDLQLNVPNPAVPAQFYIANVGGAVSKGVEVEISARAAPGVDLFTARRLHARALLGRQRLERRQRRRQQASRTRRTTPPAPACSTRAPSAPATVHGRADVVFYGAFQYNDQNTLGQDAYSLVNLRVGVTGRFLIGELFVRNAFDTRYIPLAFPYPSFAPSGFMGEMGAPRTVGVSVGVRF